MTTAKTEWTLGEAPIVAAMHRYYDLPRSLEEAIWALASQKGEQPKELQAKWQEYCRDCTNSGQSPIVSEFCQRYGYAAA